MSAAQPEPPWWHALGPGLLWAGTAVGVSHLVQSTRAGADYGLGLLWLVLAANLFKYPAFEAGPRYTSATGRSLLEGYRRRGTWVLWLFIALTVATMFTVLGGVTVVTAGLASALVSDALSVPAWTGVILLASAALLGLGQFRALERFMTAMMLLLTMSTLMSTALLLPSLDWAKLAPAQVLPPPDRAHWMFAAALAGWMPSAIDIAVWQSLWQVEKARTTGEHPRWAHARLDFNVGYVGTAVLAALFVLLGAATLHGSGSALPDGGAAFATALIDVYATALGEWARPLLLVAAFTTMVSTTVAVADGFPRALDGAVARLRGPEAADEPRSRVYWAAVAVCSLGAWGIVWQAAGSLKALIDLATALTGLTAPLLAALNLWVLRGDEVPAAMRPSPAYTAFHAVGIAFLSGLAGLYLWARFAL